jgi:hypothetical protein
MSGRIGTAIVTVGWMLAGSAWAADPAPAGGAEGQPPAAAPASAGEPATAPVEGDTFETPTAPPTAAPSATQEEEPPPPPVVLKVIPPRASWEMALMPSFSQQPQFIDAPAWLGLGFRVGGGKHFRNHRIGGGLGVSFEGAITVQWSNNFEPQAMWDFVGKKNLWLGASAGVDLMLNVDLPPGAARGLRTTFVPAPMASFRLGYSQPYAVGIRRFFVGIEPRIRVIGDTPALGAAISIGSGVGF